MLIPKQHDATQNQKSRIVILQLAPDHPPKPRHLTPRSPPFHASAFLRHARKNTITATLRSGSHNAQDNLSIPRISSLYRPSPLPSYCLAGGEQDEFHSQTKIPIHSTLLLCSLDIFLFRIETVSFAPADKTNSKDTQKAREAKREGRKSAVRGKVKRTIKRTKRERRGEKSVNEVAGMIDCTQKERTKLPPKCAPRFSANLYFLSLARDASPSSLSRSLPCIPFSPGKRDFRGHRRRACIYIERERRIITRR